MSTQQDIYAAGFKNCPPMLNKENYVPWSFRLIRYAKSRPNGKLIHTSIINGPYVRRMIPEPGDPNREVPVNETFHLQTNDELTEKELKQIEADDQAIQTILLGLPEDIYAANKHFLEKIASNLKFLNNLQPEWSQHVTIVHQTKDLHTTDYTLLYDFLKYNQKEADCSTEYEHGSRQIDADGWRNQVIQNAVQMPRIQNAGNQNGLNGVPGNANQNPNGNGNLVAARADGNVTRHNEEFDLMAATSDLDEIEEVNANYILMANMQQASTSSTQTDKALVYDSDGSAEVHNYENCYDNEIFNMFTQEEQYFELLEPIPEPHQVP
nr:hypothetical protein [Tanacetum cinerariifolium]